MGKYVACICEGSAERAIMDILLDNGKLIFSRDDLIEGEVLKCRKGADFEERHLRKGFTEKIQIYRIQDSRREPFKLSKVYKNKVEVKDVITAPEIEMLIICSEGKYKDFIKYSNLKPSTYCKKYLKYKNVKSYDFVKKYFSDINILINSLYKYRRITKRQKNELCICDLLK